MHAGARESVLKGTESSYSYLSGVTTKAAFELVPRRWLKEGVSVEVMVHGIRGSRLKRHLCHGILQSTECWAQLVGP
jgi:hypothetical protein